MSLLLLRATSLCIAGLLVTACATNVNDTAGEWVISGTTPVPIPLAEATPAPEPKPLPTFEQAMLSAVNIARAQPRKCGAISMPAVAALSWNEKLQRAAFSHSSNMAKYDFFSHTGLDGKEVNHRVRDEGYNWRAVGENISAGAADVSAVMAGWLLSPGHCANIMSGDFTEMAAAKVTNNRTYYADYWTQVFATSF